VIGVVLACCHNIFYSCLLEKSSVLLDRLSNMEFGATFIDSIFLWSALGTIGIICYFLLKSYTALWKAVESTLLITFRVNGQMRFESHETCRLYFALLKILKQHMKSDFANRSVEVEEKKLPNGKESYEFNCIPGYGVQYLRYNGCMFRIERRQQPEVICHKVPFEFLKITTLFWNKKVLDKLLVEAKESQRSHDEDRTSFFCNACDYWQSFGVPKKKRSLETVILDEGVKDKLLKDVNDFLATEEWYLDRGIPYRRGYLLYGPPGSGKSSLIRAIAGEIGYDICIMTLSAKDFTDDQLNYMMNSTPENCIILLEDVDAAFKSRESDETGDKNHLAFGGSGCSKVTFRGLLNALDGVASTEGRIIFITTNYKEKLDPALIRPGRTDVKVLVDYPNATCIEKMFKRFYTECNDELVQAFVKTVISMEKKVSMAAIQGLFLMFKEQPEEAIGNAEDYFNDMYFSKSSN
jgi:chaperone BCS1